MVDDAAVEVVAAEMAVAGRGAHLDDAVADVEDAHVEGAAAEVEDEDGLVALLVQPVGQRGGRRLVDDAQHVETGDLPASLVAVRWASLKYAGTVMTALVTFSPRNFAASSAELAQHLRADLLRRVELALDVEADHPVRAVDDVEADRFGLFGDLAVFASDEAFAE